ncbi:apoptosis inhibitor [Pseudocowpox virus]
MANRNDIDSSAVVAAYLAGQYAAAVEEQLTPREREALEALRISGDEVRSPLLQELSNAGDYRANPESSHIPAALVSALLEAPTSPGRMVTAVELCAQMGRLWTRGRRLIDFVRLVHVLFDRMPSTANDDLAAWLQTVARVHRSRRWLHRSIGVGTVMAGVGLLFLGVRVLRRT